MIKHNRIWMRIPYNQKNMAREIPGRRWHADAKVWSFPLDSIKEVIEMWPATAEKLRAEAKEYSRFAQIEREYKEDTEEKAEPEKLPLPDLSWYTWKRKPYEHQRRMVQYALAHKQFAFLCEMGTGKTLAAINFCNILFETWRAKRALIVAPKTICSVWEKEIAKDSNFPVYTAHDKTKKRKIAILRLQFEKIYCIINYEALTAMMKGKDNRMQKEIGSNFNIVILDESTRIKNPKAKTTKNILKTFPEVPYKLILSGTPVTQSPVDIYSQYRFLNNNFLRWKNWYSFRNYFCIMGGYMNYQIIGYRKLPLLKSLIGKHALQIKKEDCIDLPQKIYERRETDMSRPLKSQYTEMKRNLILEVENNEDLTAENVLVKMKYLQRISSGHFLTEQKDNSKINLLEETICDLPEGEQFIVWVFFRKSIELIEDLLKRMKIKYSVLHGDIKDRGAQIDNFQSGERRCMIGQIQTGGMGITLTAAHYSIIFENSFSLQDRKQLEDRIHRPGQNKKCVYIDLILKKSLDKKILHAIQTKQTTAKAIVDSFLGGQYE